MSLQSQYKKEILPALMKHFEYKNVMQAPKLLKVVVNVGFGKNNKEKALIEKIEKNLAAITGQKPVLTKAKIAISAFKIREGMVIGMKVTLRGQRMYDFVDKLINITFPRVRDFRGISLKQVDKTGNMSIGFKEHLSFPEIRVDEIDNIHGLEIILHTNAKTTAEGQELFKLMGFPFKKD